MKIISSRNPTVETLTLGSLGTTVTYTLYGDATFPGNQKSIYVTGIQQVDVTLAPNTATLTKFVELFQGARRVETYAVQSPDSVRIDPFSLRGVNEWASGSLTGPLVVRDMVAGTETEVGQLPLVADTIRDVFIVPCTFSNNVHFMQANADTPTRLATIKTAAVPVGVGAHRSTQTDERTFLLVDSAGTVYYVSHSLSAVPPNKALAIPANTFVESAAVEINAAGEALAIVAALSTGVLMSFPLNSALAPLAGRVIDSPKHWVRVIPLSGARMLAIADSDTDNSALVSGTALSAYKPGLVYGVSRNQQGTSYFVAEGGLPVARNEVGDTVIPFTYSGLPVSQNYPGTEFISSNGTDYQLSGGSTPGYTPRRNPIAFHTMGGKLYGYCQPRTINHSMGTFNTSTHAATLTEIGRSVDGDVLTLTLRVNCAESTWIPVSRAISSSPSFKVNGDETRIVKNGDELTVSISRAAMLDNTLVFGVGRAVFQAQAVPDKVPDQFDVEDIEDIEPFESRLTEYITLTGFDTPTEVHSSGVIYIDDVEVPDGSLITPYQTLRILVTQSSNFVDWWWVEVGGVRATFTSSQDPQPFTMPTKNRAYARLGERVISRAITNTYGMPLLFEFKSDLGYLAQYPTQRTVVLAVGAVFNIVLEVDEYGHFDVDYRMGRSDHTWMVWADDHFLDPEPITPDGDRYVEADSPPFPFLAFPPNFYAIATVPAGVRATVGGIQVPGDHDARGYLHSEQVVEFDLSDPVIYTAIPFESGRTLDFGDVVAHWIYKPDITQYTMLKRVEYVKPSAPVFAPVISLAVNAPAPVADVAPRPFVVYPMRKHEATQKTPASTVAAWLFDHVEVSAYINRDAPRTEPYKAGTATAHVDPAQAILVSAPANVPVESLPWEFVQQGSHQAPYTEYEWVESETATGPESFNFSRQNASVEMSVAASEPNSVQLTTPITEDIGANPQWITKLDSATVPIVPVLMHTSSALDIEVLPEKEEVSEGVAVEPEGMTKVINAVAISLELKTDQIILGAPSSADAVYSMVLGGTMQTTPIRAILQTVNTRSSDVEIAPEVPRPQPDYDILPENLNAANFPATGRNSAAIAPAIYRDPKLALVPITGQAVEITAFNPATLSAQSVTPSPVNQPAAELQATYPQLSMPPGIWLDPWGHIQVSAYSYEKRMTFAPIADTHNGNPDYLQRGYFATELEALQNAVNVWGMMPIDIQASQREGGEWYWRQTSKCVNMCDGCTPYGYISGG